jgi:hypothetical protein
MAFGPLICACCGVGEGIEEHHLCAGWRPRHDASASGQLHSFDTAGEIGKLGKRWRYALLGRVASEHPAGCATAESMQLSNLAQR